MSMETIVDIITKIKQYGIANCELVRSNHNMFRLAMGDTEFVVRITAERINVMDANSHNLFWVRRTIPTSFNITKVAEGIIDVYRNKERGKCDESIREGLSEIRKKWPFSIKVSNHVANVFDLNLSGMTTKDLIDVIERMR